MDLPLFHPASAQKTDKLVSRLRGVAQYLLAAVFGLLPILFVPSAYLPFSSGKVLILLVAGAVALVFGVMALLRGGALTARFPLALLGIWGIALVTFASALLSGDRHDSLFGDGLDSYTALFAFVMALTATLAMMVGESRQAVMRLYAILIFSALVVSLFHIARLIFGPETLTLGMFGGATASIIGSWNGLAIFYGLVVLMVIVALQQLPLSRAGRFIAIGVMALALVFLMIVNFNPAWWVMALISGVFCLYKLASGLWKPAARFDDSDALDVLVATVVVLIVSIVFIFAGARIGTFMNNALGISYLEVRPSFLATMDITENVFAEDPILGAGPNRFVDVWRINKDPAINQTIFWNTPFDSGYSYVTTVFIGTGLLGVVAYAVFFFGLLWAGLRFMMRSDGRDRLAHFIGVSSLLASVYLWLMSVIYVPPPTIILLAAVTTGIFIASYVRAVPGWALSINAEKGKVYGVALAAIAILLVSGTGYVTYAAVNEMAGVMMFNRVLATAGEGAQLNEIDDRIVSAFEISRNDAFAAQIAFHQLSQMRAILGVSEPTETEQQTFQAAAARAIEAAQSAVSLDPTNPFNHQLLGQVYSVLALVGVEGALDRSRESFAKAAEYDPHNPILDLLDADLALGQNDTERARALAEEAVRKKGDYTEALFFLAQLDINEGNVDRAITIVNGVAQLEPQNPARRYQLGVLLASADRLDEAVSAFEAAVALDPQYANARYFLALGYAEQGKVNEAIEQLTAVRNLNESNAAVDELIESLRQNGTLPQSLTAGEVVPERDPQGGNVTESDLESDLVTSSNPVRANANDEQATTTDAE